MSQNNILGAEPDKDRSLAINEIFYSIQGESTQAGRPTTFVRLMGCPLRCTYCDTEYAFFEGKRRSFSSILNEIRSHPTLLVEVTGGEPMAQPNAVPFMQQLVDDGFEVMIETSGAFTLEKVPAEVRIIMDVKTPGSGEDVKMLWENFDFLKAGVDEVKFVVTSKEDFDFALKVCDSHNLFEKYAVLVSPSFKDVGNLELANWILESGMPMRMQLQMHKYIWKPEERGV